jgi:hypothetical protein
MEIITLPPGVAAPQPSDCISIDRLPDGGFNLTGSLLQGDDSIALVGTRYDSFEAAEAEGLAWAEGCGVATLYVSRDSPDNLAA